MSRDHVTLTDTDSDTVVTVILSQSVVTDIKLIVIGNKLRQVGPNKLSDNMMTALENAFTDSYNEHIRPQMKIHYLWKLRAWLNLPRITDDYDIWPPR